MSHNQRTMLRLTPVVAFVIILSILLGFSVIHQHPNVIASKYAVTPPFPYNNNGITNDGSSTTGSFDKYQYTYSNNALTNNGFGSSAQVTVQGTTFNWPNVAAGTNDNWQASGQVIPLTTSGTLGFLGAASSGPSSGTATITYTDGSTQSFTLAFSDWTLNGGTATIIAADTLATTMTYRNSPYGKQTINTYVFYTSVPLAAGKTTQSVTLPTTVSAGQLHVFAIAGGPNIATTSTPVTSTPVTSTPVTIVPTATSVTTTSVAFNNEGITPDTSPGSGNFDTWGYSYSSNALATDGFASGTSVTSNGFVFNWPAVVVGQPDNWQAAGQVIPVTATGTLGILGAATNGPSTGTATVTYTDGTTQAASLTFSDWTLNGGTATVQAGDSIAATMPYRNGAAGKQTVNTYVFFTSVALTAGKTAQSVTLPATVNTGHIHIFAVSGTVSSLSPTATPLAPTPTVVSASSPRNNEGISPDSSPISGNFDGAGNSYSSGALTTAGFASGTQIISNGFVFSWPTIVAGSFDNWQAAGQTILVNATGTLAFLGAASYGPSSGQATITYTDGTTQTFTLAFSDWTLNAGVSAPLAGTSIAATLPYRNTSVYRDYSKTFLFFSDVPLTPGKTTTSITLPATVTAGQLHVFAISGTPSTLTPTATAIPPSPTVTVAAPTPTASNANDWTTYGFGPDHTFNNPNETTLSVASAPSLQLQWTGSGPEGISGQAIVVQGSVYWGSWDGFVHAATLAGAQYWATYVGQNNVATCQPPSAGVAGTPTFGTVNGTNALFIGGGDGKLYALNAQTGAILWSTQLGNTANGAFIWDSPVIANGNIYIGLSSFGDCPVVQGQLFKIASANGAIQNTFNIVANGCLGGGQWGTPTVDVAQGIVYVATGNADPSCTNEPYAQAVVALNVSNLSEIAAWQIPTASAQATGDADFGSTPTLFTATINSVVTPMVGVVSKDGAFYAFQRVTTAFTGVWAPLWTDAIANAGDCPDCGGGSIAPASYDGTNLYIAGGDVTINGVACQGSLSAVNPATGAFVWQHCFTDGHVLAAVTTANGVVIASRGSTFGVYNAATGALLYQYTDSTPYSTFYSAATISNGRIYIGNLDGNLYVFG